MQHTKYRLKKDIQQPNEHSQRAGTIFTKRGSSPDDAYMSEDGKRRFHPDIVENNLDWFEPVEEKPKRIMVELYQTFQDSLMATIDENGINHKYSLVVCNGEISEEKYEAVKKAIERELNGETWLEQTEREKAMEFWKAVSPLPLPPVSQPKEDNKEKQWEILEYRNKKSGSCWCKVEIHSVKRLSDGEVFTLGDEVIFNKNETDIVEAFYDDFGNDLRLGLQGGGGFVLLSKVSKVQSKLYTEKELVIKENNDRCNVCGGDTYYIRGKCPGTDKRKVCPTCATERLEQIQEISSKHYGETSQNNQPKQ